MVLKLNHLYNHFKGIILANTADGVHLDVVNGFWEHAFDVKKVFLLLHTVKFLYQSVRGAWSWRRTGKMKGESMKLSMGHFCRKFFLALEVWNLWPLLRTNASPDYFPRNIDSRTVRPYIG